MALSQEIKEGGGSLLRPCWGEGRGLGGMVRCTGRWGRRKETLAAGQLRWRVRGGMHSDLAENYLGGCD